MRLIILCGVLATTITASYATDFSEDFSAGKLDGKWCGCQIAKQRPVTFDSDPKESGDKHAQFTVDSSIADNTCEDNECDTKSANATTLNRNDVLADGLGPSC
jgi:hypothetical protein